MEDLGSNGSGGWQDDDLAGGGGVPSHLRLGAGQGARGGAAEGRRRGGSNTPRSTSQSFLPRPLGRPKKRALDGMDPDNVLARRGRGRRD